MFWRLFPCGYLHSKENGASALKGELRGKQPSCKLLQVGKHTLGRQTGAEASKEVFEDVATQQEVRKIIFRFLQFCEICGKSLKIYKREHSALEFGCIHYL